MTAFGSRMYSQLAPRQAVEIGVVGVELGTEQRPPSPGIPLRLDVVGFEIGRKTLNVP